MAPKNSVTIDAGYPLYAAQFADDSTLIVTGGGGEGNNGIPNKVSSISVQLENPTEPLKVRGEYEFPGAVDSPTALAFAKGTVLIGANESSNNVKAGNNKSLRKFDFSGISVDEDDEKKSKKSSPFELKSAVDLFKSTDPNQYVKLIAIASDASLAAVVSSREASTISLIKPSTFEVIERVEEDHEVKDIAISPNGKKVAYVTDQDLTCIQDGEALTLTYNKFTSNYTLTKVEFLDDHRILVGVNLKNKAGVLLLESHITVDDATKEPVLKTAKARVFSSKFEKITGLTVSDKLAAIVGNDNSLTIVNLDDFSVCKRLEKVHTFAITRVIFSPNGRLIASVSAANTVNVYEVPENILETYTAYYWALFFLLLSYFSYYVYENVPREKFLAVTAFLDELFDETPQGYQYDPQLYDTETIEVDSTAVVNIIDSTSIVVEETFVVKNGDQVEVVTESIAVDEDVVAEKVEEKLSSLL